MTSDLTQPAAPYEWSSDDGGQTIESVLGTACRSVRGEWFDACSVLPAAQLKGLQFQVLADTFEVIGDGDDSGDSDASGAGAGDSLDAAAGDDSA